MQVVVSRFHTVYIANQKAQTMKKRIYTLLLCAAPLTMAAQPMLNKVLDFTPGTVIKMVNCNAVVPGNSGPNQTWNFATLTVVDTTTLRYLDTPATNPFPGANLVEKNSDSTITYYHKEPLVTFIVGTIDSSSQGMGAKVTYTDPAVFMPRPLGYNGAENDSFKVNMAVSSFQGTGKIKVDGHGTLILPTGTFNKTLRVKVTRIEKDTIGAPLSMSFVNKITSFIWFDSLHKAPLFRIDSTDFEGSINVTSSYLHKETYPVAISDIPVKNIKFNAGIFNTTLVINGKFETGKEYVVAVYSSTGQKIFSGNFTGSTAKQTLQLGSEPAPGFYIVSVSSTATDASGISKLVKE
jgi:hypothetical protein